MDMAEARRERGEMETMKPVLKKKRENACPPDGTLRTESIVKKTR